MSRIDDLMTARHPDAVEFFRISDIASVGTGSSDRKDATDDGDFPFYVRSKEVLRIGEYEFDEEAIVIPGEGGIGEIFHYVCGKYALHQRAYRITINNTKLDTKFAYYYFSVHFKSFILSKAVSATVTSIRKPMITDFRVPIPPLAVQRQIVKVLDTFTELEADLAEELEGELDARRLQYKYYRDALLSFADAHASKQARWMSLAEIGTIFGGLTGKSKSDFTDGNARFVSYVNVFNNIAVDLTADNFVKIGTTERQRTLQRGDIIFTGSSETPNEVAMSSVIAADIHEPLYLNSFCIGFRCNDSNLLDPEFAKHLFRSSEIRKQLIRTASGVTRFNVSKARLAKVEIPVPERYEQARIAGILNRFDALVNDLSSGLPAEIQARHQQYAHYRERLLTFKEAA